MSLLVKEVNDLVKPQITYPFGWRAIILFVQSISGPPSSPLLDSITRSFQISIFESAAASQSLLVFPMTTASPSLESTIPAGSSEEVVLAILSAQTTSPPEVNQITSMCWSFRDLSKL